MQSETGITLQLSAFLQSEKGFPAEAIFLEVPLQNRLRADLIAVDPSANIPIVLFEAKKQLIGSLKPAIQQITKYVNALGAVEVPAYLVSADESGALEFYSVTDGSAEAITLEEFPRFESFVNRRNTTEKVVAKVETKKAVDHFKWFCYFASIVVFVVLALDVFNIFAFTTQQLSLFALAIALAIIPHAAKLKLLGVEFERHIRK